MSEESGDDRSADGRSDDDGPADGRSADHGSADGRSSGDGSAEGWSFDEPATPVDSETAAGTHDESPAEPSDAEQSDADQAEDDEHEPSVAGVFGARPEDAPPRPEVVPESPDLENALFLLLGVLFGIFVIYRAVVVFTA